MKYFFLALFLLIATTIYAQNITGRVHGENGEPLAGATASLLIAKDSSQLLSTATDESGNFTFRNVASNQYLVKLRRLTILRISHRHLIQMAEIILCLR